MKPVQKKKRNRNRYKSKRDKPNSNSNDTTAKDDFKADCAVEFPHLSGTACKEHETSQINQHETEWSENDYNWSKIFDQGS